MSSGRIDGWTSGLLSIDLLLRAHEAGGPKLVNKSGLIL